MFDAIQLLSVFCGDHGSPGPREHGHRFDACEMSDMVIEACTVLRKWQAGFCGQRDDERAVGGPSHLLQQAIGLICELDVSQLIAKSSRGAQFGREQGVAQHAPVRAAGALGQGDRFGRAVQTNHAPPRLDTLWLPCPLPQSTLSPIRVRSGARHCPVRSLCRPPAVPQVVQHSSLRFMAKPSSAVRARQRWLKPSLIRPCACARTADIN